VVSVAELTISQRVVALPLAIVPLPVRPVVSRYVYTFTGTAAVTSGELVLADDLALADARVSVAAAGRLAVATTGRAVVNRLDLAAGSRIDLAAGGLTIETGMTPATLVSAVVAGRGDGTWSGTSGIGSSQARADLAAFIPRTVGWLDNGDGSLTVGYAAPGDTNIDGGIDILDAANFLAGGVFDTGLSASWSAGDFTYDGVVDILDAADFLAPGLVDAGAYATGQGMAAVGSVSAVPEPAMIGIAVACVAAVGLSRRREPHGRTTAARAAGGR